MNSLTHGIRIILQSISYELEDIVKQDYQLIDENLVRELLENAKSGDSIKEAGGAIGKTGNGKNRIIKTFSVWILPTFKQKNGKEQWDVKRYRNL